MLMTLYAEVGLNGASLVTVRYRGFQQNLFGPECMCSACFRDLARQRSSLDLWGRVACPQCNHTTCRAASNHVLKCEYVCWLQETQHA